MGNINLEDKEVFFEDGYFLGQKNQEIYYRQYEVKDSEKVVVISHGFCEASEKYVEFISELNKNNISVYILDHRGHGYSGRLGIDKYQIYVDDFNDYIKDLKEFLDSVVTYNLNGRRLFLFGHSMGGAISASFLQDYNNYFEKAILSCPMLEIDTGNYPPFLAKLIANLFCLIKKGKSYIFGHGPFDINKCTIEPSGTSCEILFNNYLNKIINDDNLKTSGASFKWLKEAFKITDKINKVENIKKIDIQVLLFQSGKDTFVKPNKQNLFAKNMKNCKLIKKENAKHEIYFEREEIRKDYLNDVLDFFK